MSAHTPGPWTTGGSIYKHMAAEIRAGDSGHAIAQVWKHENAYANARLIAAAPDLLAACKAALDSEQYVNEIHPDVIEAIEAAIAKAEGK